MVRSLILIAVLLALLPMAIVMPHVGLLLWGWLDFMQPHREVYGFASNLQLNLVVAVTTIIGLVVSKERKLPDFSMTTVWLLLLTLWIFVAHFNSLEPNQSWAYTDRAWRVYLFILLILILINTKTRIHAMLWILAISMIYYSLKGGIFTILTGGQARVWGPPTTVIGDNNHLAIATACIIPILNYLRMHSRNTYVRFGLVASIVLSVVSVVGSLSRGGFIALMVCAVIFWWRSQYKALVAAAGVLLMVPAVMLIPDRWVERISTIDEFETDGSFQGRVDAWYNNLEMALTYPLTGAGLRVPYLQSIVDNYQTGDREARAAHSMYFELLGGTGFVGFFFFMAFLISGWVSLSKVRKKTRDQPQWQWAYDLATMSQVSLASFFVGGASVSMEFWSGYMAIIALGTNTLILVYKAMDAPETQPAGLTRRQRRHRNRRQWVTKPTPT